MNSALSSRLEAAVVALASHGTLKERLCAAYCDHLEDIDEHDLPDDAQRAFAEMSKAMHRARALPGDSVVRASVRKLSNEEAQRFAALIVRTYGSRSESSAAAAVPAPVQAPARIGSASRNAAQLAGLLALDGGHNGRTRTKHVAGP